MQYERIWRISASTRRLAMLRSAGASAVALGALMLMTTVALANTTGPATIHVSNNGASLTGYSCDSSEWLFVINQISGTPPDQVTVTWSNNTTENFPLTSLQNQNARYSVAVTTTNATLSISDASTFVPSGTSVGNFVLSHGSCTTLGSSGGSGSPPPSTPELDSLLLFGSGGLGMLGYALTRLRARRVRAE